MCDLINDYHKEMYWLTGVPDSDKDVDNFCKRFVVLYPVSGIYRNCWEMCVDIELRVTDIESLTPEDFGNLGTQVVLKCGRPCIVDGKIEVIHDDNDIIVVGNSFDRAVLKLTKRLRSM